MGLLSGNALQNIFGRAFAGIYEDGELIAVEMVRQPNGTLQQAVTQRIAIKIQLDDVTEAMRRSEGYAATDQRALILRRGLSLPWITTDFSLDARGQRWALHDVTTDPARAYFQARASLKPGVPA